MGFSEGKPMKKGRRTTVMKMEKVSMMGPLAAVSVCGESLSSGNSDIVVFCRLY